MTWHGTYRARRHVVAGSATMGGVVSTRRAGELAGEGPVLVIGTGWVGTRLVAAFERRGITSAAWSPRGSQLRTGGEDRLEAVLDSLGPQLVVNAAGRRAGGEDEMLDANAHFARWVAERVAPIGARLIHLGSAAEYGHPGSGAAVAESTECRPTTAYGRTKLAGTEAVLEWRDRADVLVARPFNLVGPGAPPGTPVAQFAQEVAALGPAGGAVSVQWPPTVRDLITVEQLARSLVELASVPTLPGVVNVCSGGGVSFREIVEALGRRRGVEVRVETSGEPGIPTVIGDPSLLRSLIGAAPQPLEPDAVARAVWPEGQVQNRR